MKYLSYFVLILLLCDLTSTYAQQDRYFTPNQGLSNTTFYSIAQDNDGYLWFATNNGLNKFDGNNFTVYQNNSLDTNSINSEMVLSVFVDSKGLLWVGTNSGLQVYNKKLDNFTSFPLRYKKNTINVDVNAIIEDKTGNIWLAASQGIIKISRPNNKVLFFNTNFLDSANLVRDLMNTALLDNKGQIWMGSDKKGLFRVNPYTNEVINYRHDPNKQSLCDNSILSLGKDTKGNLIIGTIKRGISIFNIENNTFRSIPYLNDPENIFNGGVYSIITSNDGRIWIGTERNGLKILNPESFTLKDANSEIALENIKDTKIHCFKDHHGSLWLAIDYAGIYLKRQKSKPFFSIKKGPENGYGLSNNIVKAILVDNSDNLWVGTDGGGLNCIPKKQGKTKVYIKDAANYNSLPDNAVISLLEDKNQNLWIGTYLGGLSLYDRKKERFTSFLIDSLKTGRDFNFVTSIISDKADNLWVTTNGGGLQNFNTKTFKFISYKTITINKKVINLREFLTSLCLDSENNLWIGSYNGLFCWNAEKSLYNAYTVSNKKLESDIINIIMEDSKKNIWAGTSKGLYKISLKTGELKKYITDNGLPNNTIFGILEDNKGNLWLSTLNGISRFYPEENIFRNYYTYDGLPGNEFRPASCFKTKNGTLYFGSTSGLVYFHPDSIHEIKDFPKIVFTNFKILNNPVKIGKAANRTILESSINETEKITLLFSDRSFTVEFTAIDYLAPEKIRYAFIMEGFEKKWNYKDYNQRFASYNNLAPGTYKFKLKSTNSDGIWNVNAREITFVIKPPFWKTWWALTIYFSIIITILYISRRMALFRITMEHKLQMERLEREKLEELNQSKMQFFSNVSHEFRTPLTLILGPVERLLFSKIDNEFKKQIEFIHKNAIRLLRLVNLLLDLQKVEKNEMQLLTQKVDIIGFLKEITFTFSELAQNKKIALTFTSGINRFEMWFDPDKLDKILFNLLSNAIKFTAKGGAINVNVSINKNDMNTAPLKEYICISVSDTGKGMKEEYLQKIFDRFYQAENHETEERQIGTGIGLHLTKYLVELHKGKITVSSKIGEGTRFDILLPSGAEHLTPAQIKADSEPVIPKHHDLADFEDEESVDDNIPALKSDITPKTKKILIVEDDYEVRKYIKMEFTENYEILEASDGIEGWTIAREKMPDLIISDVMMPGMDGIQFCKKVKTEIATSHIPVILLTAKSSIENRIEGLETGADSYIPKPFHPQHLKIRVQKLIELRKNLINKFSKSVSFEAKEMTLTSADEKFLQKAINLVKENLSNTELNIEDMGAELGISRVHLYRKLKALTNQTPSEFVRTIRLKQAAYLLAQNKINIFEVAFTVGFSSHQYFTNCFQKYFNMSPSEYAKKKLKENIQDDGNDNSSFNE